MDVSLLKTIPLFAEVPDDKLQKIAPFANADQFAEGEVVIKAMVERAKGDTGPLEVSVKLQACNESTCLLPATIKLSVP